MSAHSDLKEQFRLFPQVHGLMKTRWSSGGWQSGGLRPTLHHSSSSLFITLHHHSSSSLFIITLHHSSSSLFITLHHHSSSSLFIITLHHSSSWLFIMTLHHDSSSLWFQITWRITTWWWSLRFTSGGHFVIRLIQRGSVTVDCDWLNWTLMLGGRGYGNQSYQLIEIQLQLDFNQTGSPS